MATTVARLRHRPVAQNGITEYDHCMPRGTPFSRIAITLPAEDLAAADRLAVEHDRSRSWIVAEALRRYVATQAESAARGSGLDSSRREQLRRDLALTPLERIQAVEEGIHIVSKRLAERAPDEPLWFSSFDEFLAWRRQREATQ
jgi:Ribbon-helix-helix protein, copG family